MISYEVSIGFSIINVCVCVGSFNLNSIVIAQKNIWFMIRLLPMFILFCVSMLAETALFLYIRVTLAQPYTSFFKYKHDLYNVIVTGHATSKCVLTKFDTIINFMGG